MADKHKQSRRSYLKAAGVAGVGGLTALSGCVDSLTGGGGSGPINFGSILPITGDLSDFGPGMQKGVNIAVKDMNDAGGPLERTVKHFEKDSETDSQKAKNKYEVLVSENNIIGFVGAASSGVSVPLAKTIASDQVTQVSPASTSPVLKNIGFGDSDETKYFGRTAPNDSQQGIVMGMAMNDFVEAESAAFLHVNNAYGEGLAKKAQQAFNGETLQLVPYSSKTSDYTSTLDKLFEGNPDAVGFVGYPESGQSILQTWSDGGYGGQWVLSEGLNSTDFFNKIPDIVKDMYVSSPDPKSTKGAEKFKQAFGAEPAVFSPHSYDAAFLMGLAIHKAGEASGTAIAKNIQSVSQSGGQTVTVGEFDKAKKALDDDKSINYQGASSPVDLNENLEPLNRFAILQVQTNAEVESVKTVPQSFFKGKV
ncbi:ABC transporter substrate-binding protein [Natrinema gelatinilyticum]|uniref:ABC transporter substrate-binding protein n=1 Tax=Natrinema gelatinilyticum TaxID=2961571 RepID=UPI0020C2CAF5|nr:ABC transporter substrate-binding protein [Natrinema gelatinilyticum]